MKRYNQRDLRKSEFSYYLGDDGSKLFASRSVKARKGIITRLVNELAKIVIETLQKNERFEADLREMLGKEYGAEYILDPKHPSFRLDVLAEIFELISNDTVPVQFFRSLIARGMLRGDGQRRYSNTFAYRKGSQELTTGVKIRGLARVRDRKIIVLQSKNAFTAQLATNGGKAVDSGTSVLHLPSGKAKKIKARPSTKG